MQISKERDTKRFEGAMPGFPDDSYLCFFWKGRVALYAILKALGVGPGDRVLVPGYTCVVVPAAVCFLNAQPVYADIDPDTYNLSLRGIQTACGGNHERLKAVVVQHTYGLPADTAPIVSWARKEGIAVIEDCCHALGGRYLNNTGQWQEVGTLGDAAFFSSQWSKPVSTGLGGWTLTRSAHLAQRLRSFHEQECVSPPWTECTGLAAQVGAWALVSSPRSYWTAQSIYRFLSRKGIAIGSSVEAELRGEMPKGYAKRMSSFQHRLLQWKLARLDGEVRHRRRLKEVYDRCLARVGFPVLGALQYAEPVLLRYPVRVSNKSEVLARAREERVEIGDWFDQPLHPKESDQRVFGYRQGMCRNAEAAADQVVNLPMHMRINDKLAEKIVLFLAGTVPNAVSEEVKLSGSTRRDRVPKSEAIRSSS